MRPFRSALFNEGVSWFHPAFCVHHRFRVLAQSGVCCNVWFHSAFLACQHLLLFRRILTVRVHQSGVRCNVWFHSGFLHACQHLLRFRRIRTVRVHQSGVRCNVWFHSGFDHASQHLLRFRMIRTVRLHQSAVRNDVSWYFLLNHSLKSSPRDVRLHAYTLITMLKRNASLFGIISKHYQALSNSICDVWFLHPLLASSIVSATAPLDLCDRCRFVFRPLPRVAFERYCVWPVLLPRKPYSILQTLWSRISSRRRSVSCVVRWLM